MLNLGLNLPTKIIAKCYTYITHQFTAPTFTCVILDDILFLMLIVYIQFPLFKTTQVAISIHEIFMNSIYNLSNACSFN